jgi:U3 small nucleolar RNA-associated protein 19
LTFGLVTYRALLISILKSSREVDVDLLLMLKDEVFNKHVCAYFGLLILKEQVDELKAEVKEELTDELKQNMKNVLDTLRVITVPEESPDEEEDFLVPPVKEEVQSVQADSSNNKRKKVLDNEESSDEEDKANNNDKSKKRAASTSLLSKKKRVKLNSNASIGEKLRSLDQFKSDFAETWLLTLSLPFASAEHKLVLKHLPKYVIPQMPNPLLLADYLTRSYELGGVVAILALESLFQLIVQYNLDYPNFFVSLYKLCTVHSFNAKYHGKFMKLLHMSLRSVNIPAYMVAAFIKRLAGLALQCSAPTLQYCILQIQWLLKHHQQLHTLLHRESNANSGKTEGKIQEVVQVQEYDINEDTDLEKAHALTSSLWELEAIEQHYLYDIAKLAVSLHDPKSTAVVTAPVVIDDNTTNQTYSSMIDEELNKKKKLNIALHYKKPEQLITPTSMVGKLFG